MGNDENGDDGEDENNELENEVGDVAGNEDLDKDMWGDENDAEDEDCLEESTNRENQEKKTWTILLEMKKTMKSAMKRKGRGKMKKKKSLNLTITKKMRFITKTPQCLNQKVLIFQMTWSLMNQMSKTTLKSNKKILIQMSCQILKIRKWMS